MLDLKIEYVDIASIKPYKNNAKEHPREQIEQIKNSISEFEMIDPIGIWNNEIVEGHGRYVACKELGYDKVPVIRLDHLTDEERKAYTLIHNQLTMNTGFDLDILQKEIDKLKTINMKDFGFDIGLRIEEPAIETNVDKPNERERTFNTYNLYLYDPDNVDGKYEMPIIENDNYIPNDLIGFNYAMSNKNKHCGIHFYLDDYQFERIWNNPDDYIDVLQEYDCILSPNFSIYVEMSLSMQIWNTFRSRLIGQYYQSLGLKVIPTLCWAEEDTFEFAFDGIPKGSVVSISTISVKGEYLEMWKKGIDELIKRIEPSAILVYGGKIDYDFKDTKVIYYNNKVVDRLNNLERK